MSESSPPPTWLLLLVPLLLLALNLIVWRSQPLKLLALAMLIGAATIHSVAAHAHLSRIFNSLHREVLPEVAAAVPKEASLASAPERAVAAHLLFTLWTAFTLGIVFAALPADALTRWKKRYPPATPEV